MPRRKEVIVMNADEEKSKAFALFLRTQAEMYQDRYDVSYSDSVMAHIELLAEEVEEVEKHLSMNGQQTKMFRLGVRETISNFIGAR